MAFHVACPITCRRICYCTLGFPPHLRSEEARLRYVEEVTRVADFLKNPFPNSSNQSRTVQVRVPRVVPPPPPPPPIAGAASGNGDALGDGDEMVSAQNKRAALQKRAAAASMVAEDFARRFESGSLDDSGDLQAEDQGQSNTKVMCRMCFSGENEGSERAWKMLSCKSCNKKYHRSCIKTWAHDRDLFHWSSWTCPSCRTCEVCRRTGDPSKFMFCRRCDGAYHCYCQQPPHKNVSHGPYLCPKHTRCHSCSSAVPGNGLSTRWFLGHTCCDACGRLFVKGNYCPVCLKVYRDSESTPMVCCDLCQRWVHCQCDDISDEKYLQYQVDDNLQYKCATCRGECYQVRDLEDAVRELWRRRDNDDKELISSLREAAGLPTQDDIFSITPFSDDEESGPTMGRPLKFSIKGLTDKSPKKAKESGKRTSNKKYAKKKGHHPSIVGRREENEHFQGDIDHIDPPSITLKANHDELQSLKCAEPFSSATVGSFGERIYSTDQTGLGKRKITDVIEVSNGNKKMKMVHIDNGKSDEFGKDANKSKIINTKGPKLVIHLGGRNKGIASSPSLDASSQRENDFATLNGNEHVGQEEMVIRKKHDGTANLGERNGDKVEISDLASSQIRGSLIKIKNINPEIPPTNPRFSGGNKADIDESILPPGNLHVSHRKSSLRNEDMEQTTTEVPTMSGPIVYSRKNAEGRSGALGGIVNDSISTSSGLQPPPLKESKPLLKLKFKNPYMENQSSWSSHGEDEKSSVKGQRSKRKRPLNMEKAVGMRDEHDSQTQGDSSMNEIMDANWILQKLGKDAIGKRVEVHQQSDNSWHKGVVSDFVEGTSLVCVGLDDGKTKKLELGKQGIRFISQKPKKR